MKVLLHYRTVLLACLILATVILSVSAEEEPQRVYVKSYDGVYLPAALRKPKGEGTFPAILYIHGGVGGSGMQAAVRMLQRRVPEHFHQLGYVGMATDYRRFHFGEDEIQDVLAAYRELESYPFVDKVRGPVLYLVGSKDRLRFAGKTWIETLQKRGVTARYTEHQDMPHGFYWGNSENPPQQFHDALRVTTEFVNGHLKK